MTTLFHDHASAGSRDRFGLHVKTFFCRGLLATLLLLPCASRAESAADEAAKPEPPKPAAAETAQIKAIDLLHSKVAYSVPTMEDIILASSFSVPTTQYLKKPRIVLGDIILSLDVINTDGEFRVAVHRPAKDNPSEVGEEVTEVYRGTPRNLALELGKQQQVRFDQKRGLLLPDSDYYVVLYGVSGVSAVAWNVTERAQPTPASAGEPNSQVIWNPEVHRRLMRKGQLATAFLPDDNPGDVNGNLGGLPLALSAGGAFMMQVTVQNSQQLLVPEPATAAALLGTGMLLVVLLLRRRAPAIDA